MLISKLVNESVQGNAFLNILRVIEFLFSLYKITDHVADQDGWIVKGKICVGEIVDKIKC